MTNPTSNYGFVLPTSTDLVTDLPADFEVALQGVDTRLKALQPGTTLGDIAYSSATANTNTRLGVGSTGNVLTISGGVPVWAAPAGGGKVLQVINATYGTAAQVSSATWTDTGLTATITPTLATSKILVIANINGIGKNADVAPGVGLRVVRGATSIIQFEELAGYFAANPYATDVGGSGTTYLDSPATTSATTYKVQFNNFGGATGQAKINRAGGGTTSSITLLEIGA